MDRPYIESLHIENYGCIQDATFHFTPLHALIGPNDSGKSTVLRALLTVANASEIHDRGTPQLLAQALIGNLASGGSSFEISISTKVTGVIKSGRRAQEHQDPASAPPAYHRLQMRMDPAISQAIQGAQVLRLDPDFLRAQRRLIPDGRSLSFADERGTGLPALYDALIARDLPAYMALNQELTRLFPSVQSIQLPNPSDGTKAIGVKLKNGTVVPAELMSEGMLYYLAFAVLPYLDPTALILIEEPETGLHPARIAEVMRELRAISEKTQIILATHSPLVINEMQPEEVTVVTRSPERGTKATRFLDTADFEERSKVYALGELWLSYANGDDEAPLLQGGPRP